MKTVAASEFRKALSDFANKVAFGKERVCVERNHKPVFGVVPVDDMELLELIEDQVDLELARQALKKGKFVEFEDLRRELGV
jgi:PHD/YefM family antitoxin component YafN of YafNO toxin-antitoxin module